ncbi:MAG: citrate lyase acyl carrier protein [Synergistaceae bacterium]|nr:citrate lyase acyl carrier protein [Synergistaceae bacterium]
MIIRTASAGSLESSDCLVTVTPAEANETAHSGANGRLFASRTARLVAETLKTYGVTNARIQIQDQGALEMTLRARIETAIERAMERTAS